MNIDNFNKNYKSIINNYNRGFTLIEVLVTIAVAAVILPGIIILLSFSSFVSGQGETYAQAYSLAQKEMESIYNLKKDWDTFKTSVFPQSTSGNFKKTINIAAVERCGNQICPVGSPGMTDDFTRKVTVDITWTERGQPQNVEVISYVTKI